MPKKQTNSFGIGQVEITCTSLPGVSGGPGQFRMILKKPQASSYKHQAAGSPAGFFKKKMKKRFDIPQYP
jgi:hypothetical protein